MSPLLTTAFLFFQEGEESLSLHRVAVELLGFLTWFAMFGALGFHFFVLRRTAGLREEPEVAGTADLRAAMIGLVGSLVYLGTTAATIATNRDHLPFFDAVQKGGFRTAASLVCGVLLVLGFALARQPWGWAVAGLAGVVLALRNVATGRWAALVNPLHEAAASLWIGTLFVLVVAGLPAILRSTSGAGRRGPLVAELVARFSNLALAAAGLLGVTGLITAWRHLKYPAALWTTSYGYAFDAKMAVVLCVVGLGAWNWRGMRPRLGTEEAAGALRRSATMELAFAAVVLVITAVLVSLPAPELPGS
jgi:copper transport protein